MVVASEIVSVVAKVGSSIGGEEDKGVGGGGRRAGGGRGGGFKKHLA